MDLVYDPRTGKMVDPQTGLPMEKSPGHVQPERVSTLDQILNGTGVPERVDLANKFFNPVTGLQDAGQASEAMLAPGKEPMERVASLGQMLSGMSSAVAPMWAASKGAVPAANAVVDALTGFSAMPKARAGEFLADEFGGIKLYHGSPHDFDRFSMDKIGTGEGAQAYGHGLYFAENKDTAKMYQRQLRFPKANGKTDDIVARVADDINYYNGNVKAIGELYKRELDSSNPELAALAKAKLEALAVAKKRYKSRLYEVEVNANPEDFLDWDAPLAGQTGKPKQALDDFFDWYAGPEGRQGIYASGVDLKDVQQQFDDLSPEQFAAAMRARGVPGSRYRDAGSRGMPGALGNDETRNYVIFDENLISIVKKYGIAGAAAMLGMSAADVQQAMAGTETMGELTAPTKNRKAVERALMGAQ